MQLTTLPLCLMLAVQAAVAQAPGPTAPQQLPLACQGLRIPPEILVGSDMTLEPLPGRDYADVVQTCRSQAANFMFKASPIPAPAPVASNWLEADRRIYTELLAARGADILVVPLQVQGYGFDRIERSLMTAELAHALGAGVADPFLVSRALGEGRRRFTDAEVLRLAERIKAKLIVTGYVGHWDRHGMNVTIKTWMPDAKAPARQKDWRAIEFSHEELPHRVLRRVLPEIVAHVGVKPAARSKSVDNTAAFAAMIAARPEELAAGKAKGVAASSSLLLLASMVLSDSEHTRERLFERALIASLELDGRHARSRFTQAFALMNLERRPAALALLKNEQQPAALTLVALLNGNLPQAQAALQTVKSPFEKLLLTLALQDLGWQHGKQLSFDIDEIDTLFVGEAEEEWGPFIGLRGTDRDKLNVRPALTPKAILDHVLPLADLSLETIIKGGAVVGDDVGEVEIDIATGRHLRKATQLFAAPACCSGASTQPSTLDMIWLMESIAESRIVRNLRHIGLVETQPKQAATQIDRYRAFFDGHPGLAAVEAMNAVMLATQVADDEAATWNRRVREQAQMVLEYEQGQSERAVTAMTALGIPSSEITLPVDIYGYDYPRRSYWPEYFINKEADYLPDAAKTKQTLELEAAAFTRQSASTGMAPGRHSY